MIVLIAFVTCEIGFSSTSVIKCHLDGAARVDAFPTNSPVGIINTCVFGKHYGGFIRFRINASCTISHTTISV